MKKLLFLLAMLLSLVSTAWAQQYDFSKSVSGNTLYFKITNANPESGYPVVMVTYPSSEPVHHWQGFTQPSGSLTIPSNITNGNTTYVVRSVGEEAFSGCTNVTSVSIGASIEDIGEFAFSHCTNLASLTISDLTGSSSIIIRQNAFAYTGLSGTLNIHTRIKAIEYQAFRGCTSITTVNIPADADISYGKEVFKGCSNLTTVTVGREMGERMFSWCTSLTNVTFPSAANIHTLASRAFESCTGLTTFTIPETVTDISDSVFLNCTNLATVYFRPVNCKTMGTNVFKGCSSLATLNIDGIVTTIPANAFKNLTSLSIVNFNAVNCWTVGADAFAGCSSLTTVNIGDGVTRIPDSAFAGRPITGLSIGLNVVRIGRKAFQNCTALAFVVFKAKNCETVGVDAFAGCSSLTSVTLRSGVTRIPDSAFAGRPITTLTITDSVRYIGRKAFYNCNALTTVYFHAIDCQKVGYYAFGGCSNLAELNFYNGVTNIPDSAFRYITGITTLYIPTTVERIGTRAFQYCVNLTSVNFYATNCRYVGTNAFGSCSSLTTLNIGSNVTNIPDSAFRNCTSLTTLTIPYYPNNLNIGKNAFDNCTGLTGTLTLPARRGVIGDEAFRNTGFTSVVLPTNDDISYGSGVFSYNSNLTSVTIGREVGESMFYHCINLETVTFSEVARPHTISAKAFRTCSSLTSITIPKTITTVGDSAFQLCTMLTTVNYNAINCQLWGTNVFSGCGNLETVNFGNKVQTIPANAFMNTGLTGTLTIRKTVESIGTNAFRNCTGLTTLNYNAINCQSIGSNAFAGCSNLTTLNIGNYVTDIPDEAFADCLWLTNVYYNAIDCQSMGDDVFNANGDLVALTIGSDVRSIPDYAFENLNGYWQTLNIYNGVEHIGASAFEGCSGLQGTLTIPSSVQSIGAWAFASTGFTSVTLPQKHIDLGMGVFYECTDLTTATIGCTEVSDVMFAWCEELATVNFTGNLNRIGTQAFYFNNIESITIPSTLRNLGHYAFEECSMLETVNYNAVDCQWAGDGVFENSPLLTVNIADNVQTLPAHLFENQSGISEVTIGSSMRSIGDSAFYNCQGLSQVNFNAANCLTMGVSGEHSVFAECDNLAKIVIGENVNRIPAFGFNDSISMDSIIVMRTLPPTIDETSFVGMTDVAVAVPCGSLTAYQSAPYWSDFTNIVDPAGCSKTLTLAVNDNTMGSALGGGRYVTGSTVTFSAVPAVGYQFVQWNDNSTDNPRSVTLNSNQSYTATFATASETIPYYTLTLTSANYAQGGVMGGGSYAEGTVATIVAVPNNGFAFSAWDDDNTDNPRSVTVSANSAYQASFVVAVPDVVHDTTVVTNTIYDTTYVDVPYPVHDTTVIEVPYPIYDTTYIDNYVYDTTYIDVIIPVHDTTIVTNTIHDTTYINVPYAVHDTTVVTNTIYDTTYINVPYAVHDTTVMIDTLIVNHYIHDTGTVVVVDTFLINNYIHDTVSLTEYVTVYDTTYINVPYAVHDTSYVYRYVHDTTVVDNFIHDTTMINQYFYDTVTVMQIDTVVQNNYIHDTSYVYRYLHDTTVVNNYVHDTTYVDQYFYDTVTVTQIDTVVRNNYIHDTSYVYRYLHDTTIVNNYIHDTTVVNNYIHDTVLVNRYIYDSTYIDVIVHDTVLLYRYLHDTTVVTLYDTLTFNHYIHDTTILNNYIHDTTYITVTHIDTLTINNYIHDTTLVTMWDTAYVNNYIHDTTILNNYIHDTTIVTLWDTAYVDVFIHDTTTLIQYDTTILTQFVHDTTILNNYIHDTTFVTLWDTAYVDVYIHDTTIVDNWIYDTTYLWQYDTTYIDVYVHDTTIVNNWIYDTTYLWQYDTTYIDVYIHDTTIVDNWIYDTTYLWQYDTTYIDVYIHDTVTVTEPITYYNLSVTSANIAQGVAAGNGEFPTGSIVEIAAVPIEGYRFTQWQDGNTQNPRSITLTGDASYVASFEVSAIGINNPFDDDIIITTEHDIITVRGAAGERIRLFDSVGRQLANEISPAEVKSFQVPASGAYLVQVGNRPARKVVVIR